MMWVAKSISERIKVLCSSVPGSVILGSGPCNSGFSVFYCSVLDSMAQHSVTLVSEHPGLEFCDSGVFASRLCGSKFYNL